MRPLIVQVPEGKGELILQKAKAQKSKNLSMWQATDNDKKLDVILAFISNSKVENFLYELDKIEDVQITLFPLGVMPMYPPKNEAPDQVTNIESLSPIEIFLSGLQSKGSWKGFIGYSVMAAIVVWIGLFTNTSYLLVAAMLMAPFAGPAMNTAIATARGDWKLLKTGMMRYFVSLAITVASTFILSLVLQQEIATALMVARSQISSVTVLLAVTAGAAGALNLVQSSRDSLVSGAAVGMLIAASLAPPAGIVGMSMAIGEYEMAKSGLFLLLLQLVGINLTGSLVFLLYGLNSEGPRYSRGKKSTFWKSITVTVIVLGGIIFWQFFSQPDLQRSSLSKRAEAEIQKVLKNYKDAEPVEINARFTRADIGDQNTLLCVIYVQKTTGTSKNDETIKKELVTKVTDAVKAKKYNVTPLVNIVVMEKQPGDK